MVLGDPWIRARSDRPTHFTTGDCEPGRLGLRWALFSSTDINFCGLLNLETGVLVKYSRPVSFSSTPPNTVWTFEDTALGVTYTCNKISAISPSLYSVQVLPQFG